MALAAECGRRGCGWLRWQGRRRRRGRRRRGRRGRRSGAVTIRRCGRRSSGRGRGRRCRGRNPVWRHRRRRIRRDGRLRQRRIRAHLGDLILGARHRRSPVGRRLVKCRRSSQRDLGLAIPRHHHHRRRRISHHRRSHLHTPRHRQVDSGRLPPLRLDRLRRPLLRHTHWNRRPARSFGSRRLTRVRRLGLRDEQKPCNQRYRDKRCCHTAPTRRADMPPRDSMHPVSPYLENHPHRTARTLDCRPASRVDVNPAWTSTAEVRGSGEHRQAAVSRAPWRPADPEPSQNPWGVVLFLRMSRGSCRFSMSARAASWSLVT